LCAHSVYFVWIDVGAVTSAIFGEKAKIVADNIHSFAMIFLFFILITTGYEGMSEPETPDASPVMISEPEAERKRISTPSIRQVTDFCAVRRSAFFSRRYTGASVNSAGSPRPATTGFFVKINT
jgi:hypothetical protein